MEAELKEKLKAKHQEHLLRYWADLDLKNQNKLVRDINSINLEELDGQFDIGKFYL